jgi:hypothetical protein
MYLTCLLLGLNWQNVVGKTFVVPHILEKSGALVDTNYQSLVGPVAWKGGPTNPVPNCCTTPLVGGQWKKGIKFKYDLNVVFNQPAPNIPTDSPFEAIHYT